MLMVLIQDLRKYFPLYRFLYFAHSAILFSMHLMLGNWKVPPKKCATQLAILSEAYKSDDSIVAEAECLGFLENNATFIYHVVEPFWQHCNQASRHSIVEAIIRHHTVLF